MYRGHVWRPQSYDTKCVGCSHDDMFASYIPVRRQYDRWSYKDWLCLHIGIGNVTVAVGFFSRGASLRSSRIAKGIGTSLAQYGILQR